MCRRLVHAVAWSQVGLLTEPAMTTAVECWRWLLTSRPDIELRFLQEMLAAWQVSFPIRFGSLRFSCFIPAIGFFSQCTIDKKLGLFSPEEEEVSPLAAHEGSHLGPKPPFVKPHDIWVQVKRKKSLLCPTFRVPPFVFHLSSPSGATAKRGSKLILPRALKGRKVQMVTSGGRQERPNVGNTESLFITFCH